MLVHFLINVHTQLVSPSILRFASYLEWFMSYFQLNPDYFAWSTCYFSHYTCRYQLPHTFSGLYTEQR